MNQYGFDGLEQKIGYIYKDKKLLRQAMTHTSFANEQKMNKLRVMNGSNFWEMPYWKWSAVSSSILLIRICRKEN